MQADRLDDLYGPLNDASDNNGLLDPAEVAGSLQRSDIAPLAPSGAETARDPAPETAADASPETALELDAVPGIFTTDAGDPGGFNIDLVFQGEGWTPDAAEQVIEAAELITSMFEGDLPDTVDADGNPIDDKRLTLTIDDLGGNVLGVGGASFSAASDLPAGAAQTGEITFDDAITAGVDGLDGVAYHEIMHTLGYGLGAVWDGLLTTTPDGQLRFTGENATQAYVAEFAEFSSGDPFAAIGVPVDDDGAHLDVDIFGSDLIESGVINAGTPAESNLFELDAAIFEDLGYDTILDGGDLISA